MALSCIISEMKPDIRRKSQCFTPLHPRPLLGDPRQSIGMLFGVGKKLE